MKLRDHICIKGTVPLADFNTTVTEVIAILDKLKESSLLPLVDEDLGYYADNAKHLVSNFTVQVILHLGGEHKGPLVENLSRLGYKVQSKVSETEDGQEELSVALEGPILFNDQISFINAVVEFINGQEVASPMGMDDDQPKQKQQECPQEENNN